MRSHDVLCLGPLTNAAAVLARGGVAPGTVTIMGGNQLDDPDGDEFNFGSDPAAAAAVVAGFGDAVDIVGKDVCTLLLPDAPHQQSIVSFVLHG